MNWCVGNRKIFSTCIPIPVISEAEKGRLPAVAASSLADTAGADRALTTNEVWGGRGINSPKALSLLSAAAHMVFGSVHCLPCQEVILQTIHH
ncbi:hypothetical protein GN956_G1479 [Arapaima gigas]